MTAVDHLPYRPCVGVALIGPERRVFAGKRIDNPEDAWQMPQGGVDRGEAPMEAALRELEEETGTPAGLVEPLRETAEWLRYDLPADLVPKLWGGRFRGQEQKWFALRFLGADRDIDIATRHPEFRAWDWMTPDALMARIVPFKRAVYARVFAEFADLFERPRG